MSITEQQRRTLDLMAESAGWNWADVEQLSQQEFGECVAGLSFTQAHQVMDELRKAGAKAVSPMEIEPGVFCELCVRCGDQCTPSPNDALCWRCAKEVRP